MKKPKVKRHTVEYLESVIKAHRIVMCDVCHEYEVPDDDPKGGWGGIQARSMGKDSKGRNVHRQCVP